MNISRTILASCSITIRRFLDWVEALDAFARERGRSLLELAVGWLASQPCVASVIAGATRPEQVTANVEAGAWKLAPEELAGINEIRRR